MSSPALALPPRPPSAITVVHPPQVAVVVPVLNEEAALERSILRLHAFLAADAFPFTWRVVIADNASTDATPQIAAELARRLDGVEVMRLEERGRGRALRAAWLASDAEVVAYMDVDLSTDLRGLLPLVAPLLSGHSDVAIGTRLARSANVVRGPKRELISRTYNRLLHLVLRARFSDAQCGFKAVRADVARRLVPDVRDERWFFDTELLVLAQRRGLRIHEVPVDWVDDPDSRVDIVSTAMADLRGVARLLAAAPLARFLAVGVLSTAAYALLYVLLHGLVGASAANLLALAMTAVGNTALNRWWTFRVNGRAGRAHHYALGALIFALTAALTEGALAVLHGLAGAHPGRGVELAVLVVAQACATATRFFALRAVLTVRPVHAAAGPGAGPAQLSHRTGDPS